MRHEDQSPPNVVTVPVRALIYYATRPREFGDRVANELERRRERPEDTGVRAPHPVATSSPVDAVHETLGLDPNCPDCRDFDAIWAQAIAHLGGEYNHHDSGLGTVQGMWAVTRHLRPRVVVETGVARGFSSASVLLAMRANGVGHLYSIDLPELNMIRDGDLGAAVSDDLKSRWTLLTGASKRLLPKLLERTGSIDVFLHDSLHTAANMTFEMETAWPALRSGGVLFVDDVDENAAFLDFATRQRVPYCIRERVNHPGAFGMICKP